MKRLLTILGTLLTALCTYADTVQLTYSHGSETIVPWGTAKVETYNIAIRIADPGLAGSQLTAITVPLNTGIANSKDCKVYITRELSMTSGKAVPDICSVEFSPSDQGTTEVVLPEPYTLDSEPIYVGYSIAISKLVTDADKAPIMVELGGCRDGLFLGTSRTYRKWEDMHVTLARTLPIQVTLEGDFGHTGAAGINYLEDQQVKRGAQSVIQATIVNHGTEPIQSLDYIYTNQGGEYHGTVNLNRTITASYFGARDVVKFDTPAIDVLGTSAGTLAIVGVNGQENADLSATATHEIEAVRVVIVKRPLLEEFTGLWCGWCPRGYVGLMLLNKRHPDEFIGASYHNGDIMTITENYPVAIPGYPSANLDRSHPTDAYRGDYSRDMGIEETWLLACQEETCANVYVDAKFDEDEHTILIDTQFEFAEDQSNTNYGVAYLVTADSLCGSGSHWAQHSYFPGVKDYGPEMDMFTKGEEYLYLVYDDVVIAQSGSGGTTIKDVIPSEVHTEDIFGHTYTFDTNKMNSIYYGVSLVQDKEKLNVIAMLYDRNAKKVVNAAKTHVKTKSAADLRPAFNQPDAQTVVGHYSLDGRSVGIQQRGLTIVRHADGTMQKQFIR